MTSEAAVEPDRDCHHCGQDADGRHRAIAKVWDARNRCHRDRPVPICGECHARKTAKWADWKARGGRLPTEATRTVKVGRRKPVPKPNPAHPAVPVPPGEPTATLNAMLGRVLTLNAAALAALGRPAAVAVEPRPDGTLLIRAGGDRPVFSYKVDAADLIGTALPARPRGMHVAFPLAAHPDGLLLDPAKRRDTPARRGGDHGATMPPPVPARPIDGPRPIAGPVAAPAPRATAVDLLAAALAALDPAIAALPREERDRLRAACVALADRCVAAATMLDAVATFEGEVASALP